MHALSIISVYVISVYVTTYAYYVAVCLEQKKWSSTASFSKPFYREVPEPFPCPLLQGNSVGEKRCPRVRLSPVHRLGIS